MAKNIPTGITRPFAGSSAPEGYLLCDGSAVSRSAYAALFALVGTTFGSGDGSTTFNVPDLQGKTIYGYDSSDTAFDAIGETGGAKTINLAHTHTANPHTHLISATSGGPSANSQTSNDVTTNFSNSSHTHTISVTSGTQSATSSDSQLSSAQSILMPYITLNYIIKI